MRIRIFRKVVVVVIIVVLTVPTFTWADTSAGIKPSSLFYFLDIAFEKVNLFFIFNSEKKANRALGYAEERLQEAKEEAEGNKPKAVEKAMKNYEASISLATEESREIKSESEAETLLNTISSNTSKHQEILKDVYNKVPDEAKDAILKAIEVSQKRQEQADRQIGELRKEVVLLKDELKELQEKIKEKENQSQSKNNELPKMKTPTLSSTPTPITETDKSLKELKDELEKKLKELEKIPTPTPTSTPIKVEVVNQNPIPVQITSPIPTPYFTQTPVPTILTTPNPTLTATPTSLPSPTPVSTLISSPTPTPTPTLTPVMPGTIFASLSSDTSPSKAIFWNWGSDFSGFYTGNQLSKFTLTSANEGFYVERIKIGPLDSSEKINASANVQTVQIIYNDRSGTRRSSSVSLGSSGEVNFVWSSINSFSNADEYYNARSSYPYVPKNGSLEIYVGAQMQSKDGGATQDVQFSLDLLNIKAVGENSGKIIENINPVTANNHIVYAVYPTFSQNNPAGPYLLADKPVTVCQIDISSKGASSTLLRFDETSLIKFSVVSSGQYDLSNERTKFSVYDEIGTLLDTGELIDDAKSETDVPLVVDFQLKPFEMRGGSGRTLKIQLDNPSINYSKITSDGRAADYFQILLRAEETEINWTSSGTKATPPKEFLKSGSIIPPLIACTVFSP